MILSISNYFTSTLPDLKDPLSEVVPTISIKQECEESYGPASKEKENEPQYGS